LETYSFLIKELKIQKLGFESSILTFAEYQTLLNSTKASLFPVSGMVENIRQHKVPEEIEYLKTTISLPGL